MAKWEQTCLNTEKTVCMILSTHQHRGTVTNCTFNLKVGDKHIKPVNQAKLLDIIIDESFTWDKYIHTMYNKISKMLRSLTKFMPSNTLLGIFNSMVLTHFDYANVDLGTACGTQVQLNQTIIWQTKLDASDRKDSVPHSCTHI